MDEFPGLLARDFGFRPQGKSAPMAASKSSSSNASAGSNTSSWNAPRSGWKPGDSLLGDDDSVFAAPPPPKFSHHSSSSAASLDAIFDGFKEPGSRSASAASSLPVYDKPVYDDDIFDGVPGVKSSASVSYDDVFASMASGPGSNHVSSPPAYDDLLENLGKAMPDRRSEERKEQDLSAFDELIPGFGGSSPPRKRETSETNQQKPAVSSAKPSTSMPNDPFVVLETTSTSNYSSSGLFSDPLEHLSRPMNSERTKVDTSSASGGIFDDSSAFDGLPKSVPSFTSEVNDKPKDKSPLNNARDTSPVHIFTQKEPTQRSSVDTFEDILPKVQSTKSSSVHRPVGNVDAQSSETYGRNSMADQSPKSTEYFETADDVWLSVAEIPLFTQPTSAPPPSRPPPHLVIKQAPFGANTKRRDDEYPHRSQNYSYQKDPIRRSGVSPLDELEDFAMGKPPSYAHDCAEAVTSEEEIEKNSAAAASAAAMKDAMDRAEAKFKHAKEVRERERDAKFSRSRESAQHEIDDEMKPNSWDLEDKERQERLEWEQEQREREKEKEQRRLEKERELDLQRERARGRQAVERATREARERAAAEARLKAEKEARQRAERAAVQRAAAEARERAAKAAAEARERAAADAEASERAAAKEAREKAAVERAAKEAKEKAAAERAAVERAAAEARKRAERAAVERAAAEARERLAAAAREKQQKSENDLESFFGMGSRANSAPKQRATSSETGFDAQAQGRGGSDVSRRTPSSSASTIRKVSSTTNIVDDLSSIFGAPSSGDFQEIDGESEERRRARLERHQRTLERAAKALAEKNERDMQTQRDQAERHRIAETLDFEIKRWAAGKEGNLRALLSTLQYVLWPECGWQPVSLTDLITAAAVKKVYRKATLCIHPDKVQQKGANLQQKYIAEKVFDLLKEAWNKFNSEELF
ncbi:auxilin-related protein 2-like [Typha angustifolia]|uniref:auxilin-related protein 2-like n=1 Tax=Typha angustifolia TaxID=59011 RepID=UPI003C2C6D4A